MAITLVNHDKILDSSGSSTWTWNLSFTPTVGNVLVFGVIDGANPPSVYGVSSDGQGNSYTNYAAVGTPGCAGAGMTVGVVQFSSGSWSLTMRSDSSGAQLFVGEFAGVNTTTPVMGTPGTTSHSGNDASTFSAPAGTPSVANCAVVSILGCTNSSPSLTWDSPMADVDRDSTTTYFMGWGVISGSGSPVTANASNGSGTAAYSMGALLLQVAGPTITVQPTNQVARDHTTATFTISATGSGTVHYQWKVNGGNVGTDTNSYTTGTLSMSDNLSYVSCVLTDNNGTTTSNTVILFVTQFPGLPWFRA